MEEPKMTVRADCVRYCAIICGSIAVAMLMVAFVRDLESFWILALPIIVPPLAIWCGLIKVSDFDLEFNGNKITGPLSRWGFRKQRVTICIEDLADNGVQVFGTLSGCFKNQKILSNSGEAILVSSAFLNTRQLKDFVDVVRSRR